MEQNTTIFKTCHKPSKHVNGTSLQDYITTSFDNLVNHFGEPTIKTDEWKTSSEWHVEIVEDDSTIGAVAIYDYKQCKTYAGDDGLDPEYITEWHVGAKNPRHAQMVTNYINNTRV